MEIDVTVRNNPIIVNVELGGIQGPAGQSGISTTSGDFYLASNPSGFIGSSGLSGYLTTNQSGLFYSATNPSGFITTGQTGVFVTTGQTGQFITSGQTGNFASSGNLNTTGSLLAAWTGASTGLYYPRDSNISGYVTTGQTGAFVSTGQTGLFITGTQTTGSVIFKQQYASLEVNAASGINWNSGNVQYYGMVTGIQTLTFTNPISGGRYILILNQPASGTGATVNWPTGVLWGGGTSPTLTTTTGKVDLISFIYDGINSKYYSNSSLNF